MKLQGKPGASTQKKPATVAPMRAIPHVPKTETDVSKKSDEVKIPGEVDPSTEIGTGQGHSNDPKTDKTPIRIERKVISTPAGKMSKESKKKPAPVK